MIEVYYYLPLNEVDHVVECGLKLSRWFDKEVWIGEDQKKCISGLLNPKDDMDKYRSSEYKCIKLELMPEYCFVADKYLYEAGLHCPEVMEMYYGSIIPVGNYIFGSYRLPECLVTGTVISEQISVLNKRLDSPVLFGNSEELYINNIIEAYKEEHEDFNDTVLYYFYHRLEQIGKVVKIVENEKGVAVFFDKAREKAVTIKIPDMKKY